MSNKAVLKEIFEKAMEGGWGALGGNSITQLLYDFDLEDGLDLEYVIFSHDFAKAFWSEEGDVCQACRRHHEYSSDCDAGCYGHNYSGWQYHLQQLALSEDRPGYLKRYL